jgi:hypothetical protein
MTYPMDVCHQRCAAAAEAAEQSVHSILAFGQVSGVFFISTPVHGSEKRAGKFKKNLKFESRTKTQ